MTELKRPESYVQFESIKPKLKEVTEFYTRKTADYQYRLKQLNEYADALENEISVLKETPKVEVLLDDMAKPLVVVPQIVADYIKTQKDNNYNGNASLIVKHYNSFKDDENDSELNIWIANNFNDFLNAIVNGYTVEKKPVYLLKHIDMSKEDRIYDWYVYRDLDDNRLWHASLSKGYDMSKATIYHFTQAEIEKLHTGSYEQIEVKFVEVEE